MSVEYSSPNDNLILKKKNPFLGQQLTQFPQYKSAVPNPPKFKNDIPQILSYEGFNNNKKFKGNMSFKSTIRQSIITTAKNMGYLFVPGIKFQTLTGKSVISSQNVSSVDSFLQNTKSQTNVLSRTIAIYYTGSTSTQKKCYYKRQFWLEDIVTVDAQTQASVQDQGIFFRKIGDVNDIISTPEDPSNYYWLNNGDDVFNTSIYNEVNGYNLLNNVQFITALDKNYVIVDEEVIGGIRRIKTYNQEIQTNNPSDFDPDVLNKFSIFKLEKQNKTKSDNNFALKVYYNSKWNYISCNYYGGNNVCGLSDSPEYRTIELKNNKKTFEWGGIRIKQDWGRYYHWYICAQTWINDWFLPHKNKLIHPNYNYIYQIIFSDPSYGAQPYICLYGVPPNDDTMLKFAQDNGLDPPSSSGSLTDTCETILSGYCTKNIDGVYPNLFSDECSIACKNSLTGMCDDSLTDWCTQNKPADNVDVNSDTYTKYLKKCGCFMPGNYYNNLENSYSAKGFSLPSCVKKFKYTICGNADFKDKASQIAAADSCNVDIMNCVQSVNIDNKGNISGDINVSQGASCQQLRKIVSPSGTGTNIVPSNGGSTAGTGTAPGTTPGAGSTTGTGTTSGTTSGGNTPFPNITPAPATPAVSNKILGLDPMVFYGIIGAVVFLLIILIVFLMMRKGGTQAQPLQ